MTLDPDTGETAGMTDPDAPTRETVMAALRTMPRGLAVNTTLGVIVAILERGPDALHLLPDAMRVLDELDPFMGGRVRGHIAELTGMRVRAWALEFLSWHPIQPLDGGTP